MIIGSIIIYILYQIYKIINNKIGNAKFEKRIIEDEIDYINNFLRENVNKIDKEKLKTIIKEAKNTVFHEKTLKYYKGDIKNNLTKARKLLIELDHEEQIKELKNEKRFVQNDIDELEQKKRIMNMSKEERERETFRKLKDNFHRVFEKSKLSKEEIKVLMKRGYSLANEYCVKEKRVVPVIVKPFLNHSKTHAFLMWSVRRLLDEYDQIQHIKEYLTRNADFVFTINGETYAIEIETGSLVRKKKQLQEKLEDLNSKYKDRWIFLVSHRSLLPKFRKYGKCTQRSKMRETLEKWLKS